MNFGGYEVVYSYERSSVIVLPVPYDDTSTYMKGADKGPDAVMEASVNLEFYDIETDSEAHKHGIFTLDPLTERSSPEALVSAVHKKVKWIIEEGKFPVLVGGNHSVSIGAFRAVAEKFTNLTILQIDAHSDMRQEYEGSPFNHACAMARASEVAPIVQMGIRSMSVEELAFTDMNNLYPAHQLHYDKKLYSKALASLDENVYITIDLDAFDPSLMPSTGTPEPGGPGYYDIMHFLRDVAFKRNVVGFDVVELCPNPNNKVPDFIAAKVIYQLLSYIFKGKPL
jgi:agmatinase